MPLTISSAPSTELLTVAEAKRHLRIYSDELDDEVTSLIRAARDYCERFTQRTLRTSVTRLLKLDAWWSCPLELPWPPLLSTAPAVAYYDADNASQTLATSNYHVELSTEGGGRLVWADDATIPEIYTRPDAITVTFYTGYADADALPPVALQAMKTKLTELYGTGSENEVKAAKECTDRLLGLVDWSGYA